MLKEEEKNTELVNGTPTLTDDKPKDITERIKTVEDACTELGKFHPYVMAYRQWNRATGSRYRYFTAYLELCIITAALNEGWEPQFVDDGKGFIYPSFVITSMYDIDESPTDDTSEVRLQVHNYGENESYNLVNLCGFYSIDAVCLQLAFKSQELAKYAFKQFCDIYGDFCLGERVLRRF